MFGSLGIELIGDDMRQRSRGAGKWLQMPARAWVAEITGWHARYGYRRTFLRGRRDYASANSVGSRGIWCYYVLESGHLYDVSAPVSWHQTDRYYCTVAPDGRILRLTDAEVTQWLANGAFFLAATCLPPHVSDCE